jgi:hypothetical protein
MGDWPIVVAARLDCSGLDCFRLNYLTAVHYSGWIGRGTAVLMDGYRSAVVAVAVVPDPARAAVAEPSALPSMRQWQVRKGGLR